jgi:hypothetical protein
MALQYLESHNLIHLTDKVTIVAAMCGSKVDTSLQSYMPAVSISSEDFSLLILGLYSDLQTAPQRGTLNTVPSVSYTRLEDTQYSFTWFRNIPNGQS